MINTIITFLLGIYVNVLLVFFRLDFDQRKENYQGAKNALNQQHPPTVLYCFTRFVEEQQMNACFLRQVLSSVPPSSDVQLTIVIYEYTRLSVQDVNLVNETFTQIGL